MNTFFFIVQDSCEAADDSVLDLVDFCHRKLTLLASKATHSQNNLTGKSSVSSIEVNATYSSVVGLTHG